MQMPVALVASRRAEIPPLTRRAKRRPGRAGSVAFGGTFPWRRISELGTEQGDALVLIQLLQLRVRLFSLRQNWAQ